MRVGDLARATGLTVRTLHHYDELGLVVPSGRTSGGHRDYGDADVRRLYQVVALRRLGFPLAEIRGLLDGPAYDPRETVRRQLAETERRLAAERELRQRLTRLLDQLDRGEEPTTEDLLRAVEATTMSETYYTPEQLAALEQRRLALGEDGMAKAQQDWAEVIAGFEAARVAGTSPDDPEVQAIAARARGLLEAFTGGDPAMYASLRKMYETEGAEKASRGSMKAETAEYMQRAMGH
ncbi:MAG TPA: MerR family transcriptional regulator [Mycobacteriales bacterium]|jgi:DNA-binding transcriptional MerR regulator|nr:MerR family transcriptional regulator [Mycobacteriales bacterium]